MALYSRCVPLYLNKPINYSADLYFLFGYYILYAKNFIYHSYVHTEYKN